MFHEIFFLLFKGLIFLSTDMTPVVVLVLQIGTEDLFQGPPQGRGVGQGVVVYLLLPQKGRLYDRFYLVQHGCGFIDICYHFDFCRSRESSDAENPGNNLYVTGLSSRLTKDTLEKHFASEGKVCITGMHDVKVSLHLFASLCFKEELISKCWKCSLTKYQKCWHYSALKDIVVLFCSVCCIEL